MSKNPFENHDNVTPIERGKEIREKAETQAAIKKVEDLLEDFHKDKPIEELIENVQKVREKIREDN
jgi:hypothetical protein